MIHLNSLGDIITKKAEDALCYTCIGSVQGNKPSSVIMTVVTSNKNDPRTLPKK